METAAPDPADVAGEGGYRPVDGEAGEQPGDSPADAEPNDQTPTTGVWRYLRYAEAALAVGIAACVVAVHDVPYLLKVPFWVDEAWVAASTRASIGHLLTVTSSSPIGFTGLLRVVPGSGQQDLRLLPLFFAALAALAAYAFGRNLKLLPVVAAVLAAGAALLAPAMLVRDDLKQYTADAFAMVLGLALLAWLEAEWSRRRLIILAASLLVLSLVTNVALFVAAVGLPAATIVQAIRRRRANAIDGAVVTVITGALMGILFLLFDGGTQTAALKAYWNGYYLPHHLSAAYHYLDQRIHQLLPYFGVAHLWLLIVLVLLGLAVIAWQGRWATAALLPLVAVLIVVLSALQKYPLLDQRTSTFLVTAAVVVAAIGVAGLATLAARRVHLFLGIGIAAAAVGAYLPGVLPYVDKHAIPYEDVRDQVNYVEAQLSPKDVILVDQGASWAYGYYAKPTFRVVKATNIGFSVAYPAADRTVVLLGRAPTDVRAGLAEAWALAQQQPGARLWVILSHVPTSEMQAWDAGLRPLGLHEQLVAPRTDVRWVVVTRGGASQPPATT